jgi:hypothetical protein
MKPTLGISTDQFRRQNGARVRRDHRDRLAFALPSRAYAAWSAPPEDHTALATMLTEGDFVWAGLVYGEREGSDTVGLVETFHVSELDRLVSRLLELREAFVKPADRRPLRY